MVTTRAISRADLLIREPSEITTAWLARALDRPGLEVTDIVRIGTGQMSLPFRVSFRDGVGAGTVVVKLSAENQTSRATGVGTGLDLLPKPGSAPAALRPDAEAESPHESGSAQLWNESWYFDAVSAAPEAGRPADGDADRRRGPAAWSGAETPDRHRRPLPGGPRVRDTVAGVPGPIQLNRRAIQ